MTNKDKRDTNSKFNFVTMENLEKTLEDFNENNNENPIELSEAPETVNVHSFDVSEEEITIDEKEEKSSDEVLEHNEIKHRIHFSFEARLITMIVLILAMFGGACVLILESLNYGSKQTIKYDETATANYQVCLEQNDYYSASCITENMEYVSSLTKNIPIEFKYNVKFSEEIEYDLSYRVLARTKIYDRNDSSKILFTNEDILVDSTKIADTSDKIDFTVNAELNYKSFTAGVMNYNNRYSLNSSSDVEVVLYLDDAKETRAVSSVVIPLATPTFGITKTNTSNLNKNVTVKNETWNDYNTLCAVIASLLIIISLLLLYKTTRLVLKVTTNRNKYQTKLTQLLREYDRIIVIARDGYESNVEKQVIKVESFEELLDARDALEKPIIFSKVNEIKSEFIVEDDEKLFKFVLKESDL